MEEIDKIRKKYAEEIAHKIVIMSPRLQKAFAKVPKEKFLGSGPWKIWDLNNLTYNQTEDDNPEHLYHDVLIAIDEKRYLNNGQPSVLAAWINSLNMKEKEKVLHIGCGLGYYTAIMAEMVGLEGEVTGLEIDKALAERAKNNLETYPNVQVLGEDGSTYNSGKYDVIFVNAGATHPLPEWLDCLNIGGRILIPLTVELQPGIGFGYMLKFTHEIKAYYAEILGWVGIYHCLGARDDKINGQLKEFLEQEQSEDIFLLNREKHPETDTCRLHTDLFCLSADAKME